jgi:hypothetical protein
MGDEKNAHDRVTIALRYLARIVSTLMAGFILLFAIGEGVGSLSRGEGIQCSPESIRMTIYFIAIALGAIFAWWRDVVGGAILAIVGVLFIIFVFLAMEKHDYWITLIFGFPFLLSGLLLLLCWRRSKAS